MPELSVRWTVHLTFFFFVSYPKNLTDGTPCHCPQELFFPLLPSVNMMPNFERPGEYSDLHKS